MAKRLLRIFLIYLLPLMVMAAAVECGMARVINSNSKKKTQLKANLSRYRVLIVGDSLPYYGIDPSLLDEPGYNLSQLSQTLYYDYELIKAYAPKMPQLKVVVIALSFYSFGENLGESQEYWRMYFYERVFGFPLESGRHQWDVKRFSWIKLYGGRKTLRAIRNFFKLDLASDMMGDGFTPRGGRGSGAWVTDAEGKALAEIHNSQSRPEYSEKNLELLENSVLFLKAKGVVPVFVTLPVSKGYAQAIDQKEYQSMRSRVDQICRKHGIRFANYLTDSRFTSEDFSDPNHLGRTGAEKFSRILNLELISPALAAPEPERRNIPKRDF